VKPGSELEAFDLGDIQGWHDAEGMIT